MKIYNSKKGEGNIITSKSFHYMAIIFISLIMVTSSFLFTVSYIQSYLKLDKEFRNDVVLSRITNTCFSYVDRATSRNYASEIDTNKFGESYLESCFSSELGSDSKKRYRIILKGPEFGESTIAVGSGATTKSYEKSVIIRLPSGEKEKGLMIIES